MTTPNRPFRASLTWQELYQLAMLELDPARLPQLIDQACEAVLDRLEDTATESASDENEQLNDALNGLRMLRREYEHGLKQWNHLKKAS